MLSSSRCLRMNPLTDAMKLIAIMSLDAYAEALHDIYRDHRIKVFSELDIRGYHHEQPVSGVDFGWFGRSASPAYSTLTFAFLEAEQATALLDAIAEYNEDHDPDHPIRAFLMPVERSV